MVTVTALDADIIHKMVRRARGFASLDYCVRVAKENGFWERIEPDAKHRDRTLRGLNGKVYWTNGRYHTVPVEGGYWTVEANNKRVFVPVRDLCLKHGYWLATGA